MYGYIYLTHDSLNNRYYIGQHKWTKYELLDEDYTRGFEKAFRDRHGFDLFKIDPNYLGSGKHLLNAIKKYGKENFYILDILDIAETKEELNEKEKEWIRYYKYNLGYNLYNISEGGDGGFCGIKLSGDKNGMYGKHHTSETKKHLREIMIKKNYGNGFKDDYKFVHKGKDNGMYGRKHTEYSKELNRQKHIGKKASDETREKMRKSHNPNNIPPNLKGYKGINDGIIYKKVPADKVSYYLGLGWKLGTPKKGE